MQILHISFAERLQQFTQRQVCVRKLLGLWRERLTVLDLD